MPATSTLPHAPFRGTLALVNLDETALADRLLRQRVKSRLFGDDDSAVPVRIAGYTLEGRVGEGGMGVVYRAHDPELDRSVALKLMHPELTGAAERIRGEARALARLAHPNVVSVHEIGEHEGRLFVAMEFVDGITLKDWLVAHRPTPASAWTPGGSARALAPVLDCFVQAARGLHAAHTAGLVHRDFKPENVLVGADGRVRVVDFGIASHAGAAAAEVATTSEMDGPLRTRTGDIVGTPAYMAPEQFTGGTIDARTDQFAFCVALYEAVCGRRPFPTESLQVLMQAVISGEMRPLPRRVPRSLRAALLRGLNRDPGRRFPDMAALIAAIDHVHRTPGMVALSGLLLLAGAATLIVNSVPSSPVPEAMSQTPAGPPLLTRMWQALPPVCLPEAPATDKEALKLEIKALTEQMNKQPEGSPAQLDIKVKIIGRLLAAKDQFACTLGQQTLARGLPEPAAERTRCLLRRYCSAPAAVTCPALTKPHATEGCTPATVCKGELPGQSATCVSTGDPGCCMSALIVREYEQRKARIYERPESRAELLVWAERACDGGVAAACAQAAELGSPRADRRRRACELGHLGSCAPIPKVMQ